MLFLTTLFVNTLLCIQAATVMQPPAKYIVCVEELNEIHTFRGNTAIVDTISFGDFHAVVIEDPSPETLTSLAHDDNVILVEKDQEVTADYGWGLDRVNQRHLPLDGNDKFGCYGDNVDVYILDTGIRVSHKDFGGRAVWGANFVGDGKDTDCQHPTYHGTHVASTAIGKAYGIARKARAIAVKVLSCTGSGTYVGVMKGIQWSVTKMIATGKKSVMNLSLGGGKSEAMNAAIEQAVKSGMHTVVAAGNSDADACRYSPASAPSAITVASSDKADRRSSFSNWGCCIDLFAPGQQIPAAHGKDDHSFHYLSGTSMASPHAAGVAALLLGQKNYKPIDLVEKMLEYATDDKVTDPKESDNELLYLACEGGGDKCEQKKRRKMMKN